MLADKLLFEALRFSHACKWACSEEVPEPVDMEGVHCNLDSSVDLEILLGILTGCKRLDLLADIMLFEALRFSHTCKWACVEKVPEPVDMEGQHIDFTLLRCAYWSDRLLFEALRLSHVCKLSCSEEVPEPVDMEGQHFGVLSGANAYVEG